ncbi:MAG: beta-galactosidase trimerization domain-containing protein, partial [Aristaeellaceae bacterium]
NTTVEQLLRYPVLIAPHQVMLTKAQADLLTAYAEQGGTLIVGCRTGQKDGRGHCVMVPMPGALSAATGTQVKDFTFLSPAEEPITADWDGKPLDMPVFNDVLEALPGATVLARYASGYYKGEAALVENRVGRGRVLHLGACFSRENLTRLLAYVGCLSPWADTLSLPEGVELTVREKDGARYLFLLNYMAHPLEVVFHKPAVSLLTGNKLEGTVTLEAYQAEVVTLA